jgi:hypothetical protein
MKQELENAQEELRMAGENESSIRIQLRKYWY